MSLLRDIKTIGLNHITRISNDGIIAVIKMREYTQKFYKAFLTERL